MFLLNVHSLLAVVIFLLLIMGIVVHALLNTATALVYVCLCFENKICFKQVAQRSLQILVKSPINIVDENVGEMVFWKMVIFVCLPVQLPNRRIMAHTRQSGLGFP